MRGLTVARAPSSQASQLKRSFLQSSETVAFRSNTPFRARASGKIISKPQNEISKRRDTVGERIPTGSRFRRAKLKSCKCVGNKLRSAHGLARVGSDSLLLISVGKESVIKLPLVEIESLQHRRSCWFQVLDNDRKRARGNGPTAGQ